MDTYFYCIEATVKSYGASHYSTKIIKKHGIWSSDKSPSSTLEVIEHDFREGYRFSDTMISDFAIIAFNRV